MASSIVATSNNSPHRLLNTRMVQNFHLVWLDESIDEVKVDYCRNSVTELRQVANTVNTFVDVDECIDFITDVKENAFVIISAQLSNIIIPIVQDIAQVNRVYIFNENNVRYEKRAKLPKVAGVYTTITSICQSLKQATEVCNRNSASISFVERTDKTVNQNLDQLDSSFMYTQILKEILLTINFDSQHINEFLTHCRELFSGNTAALETVDKIEREYSRSQPIWWYTSPCFLYSMLNKALRTMEVDLIIKMGFFVRDLHNNIATLHAKQYIERSHSGPFIVYRGQGLSPMDFNQLKRTQKGLISFNNFVSTSLDRAVSLAFAESSTGDSDLIGVLFEINIDPSISSTSFANVNGVSYYQEEEEILFSMHSVFRVERVEQIQNNDRLWQVQLILTNDNDPQLQSLTKCMQEETDGATGWFRLGRLIMKVAQFDKAQQVFDMVLDQTTDEIERSKIYYNLGWIKMDQGKYIEAIAYYEKSLEIRQKTLPENHPDVATTYNNIGCVYIDMREYSKALSYYEKALEIRQKTLPENHSMLSSSYHNIGAVYDKMGEYSKALLFHEQALEIQQKILPKNHPDVTTTYNNIGCAYGNMGEYSKAFSYFEKALESWQRTLPENHPLLGNSYHNIGALYEKMGEYSKALSSHEKALQIYQKTLPKDHPNLTSSYNNIGSMYKNMSEYSKAHSYYEKALEIEEKTLPADHPSLTTSYNNIGGIYENMGEYSKALSSHEKALETKQKTLAANDPNWACSYNNIGAVYYRMHDYPKALSYYEKALEICQKTLSADHSHLATSYGNIGLVYKDMGEYSNAVSYYEKSLEIEQKTLAANDPELASSYNNIGAVYYYMRDYPKALSYYEQAFEICQKTLPANHRNLATSYNNIANVYGKMGEYLKALSYYEKSMEIEQKNSCCK